MTRARTNLFLVKKRTLIPGVTGLRNLGNTCYINSILQALGHLEDFREFFCHLVFGLFSPSGTPLPGNSPSSASSPMAKQTLLRLNTIDYFEHLSNGIKPCKMGKNKNSRSRSSSQTSTFQVSPQPKKHVGLNGGGCEKTNVLSELKLEQQILQEVQSSSLDQATKDRIVDKKQLSEAKANALKAL
ncbi:ubiquitin carboxyl-terminal hydrolase 44 [Elysia marginata]|uniref:ubiquitinyl hydrolase 1 n=1 Tax=Elysia marginata TaxID=1093978 RepID=A0AAV4GC20_9GAST|nr:ubiquitin carboxyl-terminal hydrolase 44 [Elysia marginata]